MIRRCVQARVYRLHGSEMTGQNKERKGVRKDRDTHFSLAHNLRYMVARLYSLFFFFFARGRTTCNSSRALGLVVDDKVLADES